MAKIQAISFDCYGTLVDWEQGIQSAFGELFAASGLSADSAAVLESFGRHESRLEAIRPIQPYFEVLQHAAMGVGKDMGVDLTLSQAQDFANSVGDWPLFADVLPFLGQAHGKVLLAILSNVDALTFANTLPKFAGHIDLSCIAGEIGAYKPDPLAFEALLGKLGARGIERDGLLHVAQSQFHDIEPAARLGIQTCWVDRRVNQPGWGAVPAPEHAVRANHQITSLAELPELIDI